MNPSLRSRGATWSLALGLLSVGASSVGATRPEPQNHEQRLPSLRAFAKLYGYVRYFHPSDEAQEIEWDRFAIYGAERASKARDRDELLAVLEELFLPIAPTLQLYRSGHEPEGSRRFVPEDTNGLAVVAWQHRGVSPDPILVRGRQRGAIYRSARVRIRPPSGTLFDDHPEVGEVAIRDLGSGLTCEVPLTLYSGPMGTVGPNIRDGLDSLQSRLSEIDLDSLTADDEPVRLAGVVIAWNVFQHFYPYFDVVEVDWDAELTRFLEQAIEDRGEWEFFWTLKGLVAALQDGHGSVRHPRLGRGLGLLPLGVDWIEGKVVVTIAVDTSKVRPGDVVLAVDGVDVQRALLRDEEYVSGSPHWKRVVSLRRLGWGEEGSTARLLLERNGDTLEVRTVRGRRGPLFERRPRSFDELERGVYYVDLTRLGMREIQERIDELAAARGVVFDIRGYPQGGNRDIVRHLLPGPVSLPEWRRIPEVIYPDRDPPAGFEQRTWRLAPWEPRITGKVVFLTDARAISQPEGFLSVVRHYRLGEIVGQPTAGTNGNVNAFGLPGGFTITWTGMVVLKPDGSRHHLIGVQPTVPVQRTIRGVVEGRDEVLEKALEIIRRSERS